MAGRNAKRSISGCYGKIGDCKKSKMKVLVFRWELSWQLRKSPLKVAVIVESKATTKAMATFRKRNLKVNARCFKLYPASVISQIRQILANFSGVALGLCQSSGKRKGKSLTCVHVLQKSVKLDNFVM